MKMTTVAGAFAVCILILTAGKASAQDDKKFAVGFRIGEPLGANVRMYLPNNRALDANFGSYGLLWGTNRKYGSKGRFKNTGWELNVNYLFRTNSEGKKVQAYYGFGGMITGRRSYPDRLAGLYEKKTGIGATGVAGVEYFVPDSPLSLFADAGLYVELIPVPLFLHVHGGVGARFNF